MSLNAFARNAHVTFWGGKWWISERVKRWKGWKMSSTRILKQMHATNVSQMLIKKVWARLLMWFGLTWRRGCARARGDVGVLLGRAVTELVKFGFRTRRCEALAWLVLLALAVAFWPVDGPISVFLWKNHVINLTENTNLILDCDCRNKFLPLEAAAGAEVGSDPSEVQKPQVLLHFCLRTFSYFAWPQKRFILPHWAGTLSLQTAPVPAAAGAFASGFDLTQTPHVAGHCETSLALYFGFWQNFL